MLWTDGPQAPALNMARDEALLQFAATIGAPVLRFYGWTEPAATFGYFQRIADIEAWTPLRPLIRRPTGGGLVPHDADWTYCVAFPPGDSWHSLRAEESYRRIHELVSGALNRLGAESRLSPCCVKETSGQCFSGAEKFDVVGARGKLAGAAQRRNKLGVLVQGSVQPGGLRAGRDEWERAFVAELESRLGVATMPWQAPKGFEAVATRLASEKFSTEAYNRLR